jgi:hypothetical protein
MCQALHWGYDIEKDAVMSKKLSQRTWLLLCHFLLVVLVAAVEPL